MKRDAWMPFYVADYLADTMHLTAEQHGAYLLLIMAAWKRGGALPDNDDQLAGIAKLSRAAWRKNAAVIRTFFKRRDGMLIQSRVEREVEKTRRLSETRREIGLKGGRPRKQAKSKPKPKANQNETPARVASPSPSQIPSESIVETIVSTSAHARAFERFWAAYPNKVEKPAARKLFDAAVKRAGRLDVILGGLERAKASRKWCEGYIPNPARWLRNDGWADEPDETARGPPLTGGMVAAASDELAFRRATGDASRDPSAHGTAHRDPGARGALPAPPTRNGRDDTLV